MIVFEKLIPKGPYLTRPTETRTGADVDASRSGRMADSQQAQHPHFPRQALAGVSLAFQTSIAVCGHRRWMSFPGLGAPDP